MNQEFLLSADSINPTINNGGKKHAVNNHSDVKDEGRQAFSSELDKHIDKQDPAEKTTSPDAKQSPSQDVKTNDQHQRQAEETESRSGKALPDDQIIVEETENIEVEQNIENPVVVDDGVEVDAALIEAVQSLAQYSAVVSQLKESVSNTTNAVVTDTHKKIGKGVSIDVEIKQQTVIKQDTDTSNQNKQQEVPRIRPDILQALSAKSMAKDSENSPIKSALKTLLTTEQFVDKKPAFKDLQLTELVKAIVPNKAQQLSQLLDRSGNTTATAFVNTVMTGVTESVARSEVPSLDIQPAVQSKAWSRVLSGRVIWMAREGIEQATIKLNPANLGLLEVKLTMNDEKVHVTFIAQHAATRDALEQALPRLRESFIENGLEYADADVLQQDFQQADSSQADQESVNAEAEQSVLSDDRTDTEQQLVATEHDIEVGVSLYA